MAEKLSKLAVESQTDNVTDVSVHDLAELEKVITFRAGGITYKIFVLPAIFPYGVGLMLSWGGKSIRRRGQIISF